MSRPTPRAPGCNTPPSRPSNSFDAIIGSYIDQHRWRARGEAFFYKNLSLPDAIEHAALCKRLDGKRHSHQYRIPAASLVEANRRLQHARPPSCQSFEQLHDYINATIRDIHRIGELAVYDIAHRIGAHLGLAPTSVYLHSGTRTGASHLGFRGRRTIEVAELPAPFAKLSAAEIEDCLCIFKDDLARMDAP